MNKKKIQQLERKLQVCDELYWAVKKFEHAISIQEEETKELVFKLWINLRKVISHTNIELERLKNEKK